VVFHYDRPAGIIEDLVAVNLDIPATILEIAGSSHPTQGKHLFQTPLKSGERWVLIENFGYLEWRNYRDDVGLPRMIWAGVRTPTDKLVEYANGDREYFVLSSDPYETQNLIENAEFQTRIERLQAWLNEKKGFAILTEERWLANVGKPFERTLSTWGGFGESWSIASGALPHGLRLDTSTGIVSGIPESSGRFTFKIRAISDRYALHRKKPQDFEQRFEILVE